MLSWRVGAASWRLEPPHRTFTGHTGGVSAVALGQVAGREVIVSGSTDDTVRVWDAATGTPLGDPLRGHTGWVYAVALGQVAGREVIVSGSTDRTVRVWDAATGTPLGDPLRGHTDGVNAIGVASPVLSLAADAKSRIVAGTHLGWLCLLFPTH